MIERLIKLQVETCCFNPPARLLCRPPARPPDLPPERSARPACPAAIVHSSFIKHALTMTTCAQTFFLIIVRLCVK